MATMTMEQRIEFLMNANRDLDRVHEAAGGLAARFDGVNQARENIEVLWTLISRANELLSTIQQTEA